MLSAGIRNEIPEMEEEYFEVIGCSKGLKDSESISKYISGKNKIPFCIGGDHLITLPAIKPLIVKHSDLHIIQIDAHLDIMEELFGERYSHGTIMRRIYDLIQQSGRIYQICVRSGSKEEYQFALKNTCLFPFETKEFLNSISELKNVPIYLTVDLDVFDPSLIPGTGTPEAGGIFFPEFIQLLQALEGLNIVGADMVELAPRIDPTNVSTIVASKVLREMLMIL